MNTKELQAHMQRMLDYTVRKRIELEREGGDDNASEIKSPQSISEREVRTQVGRQASLRKQSEGPTRKG